ncbi:MAG: hypothetical protein H6730_17715 [Deltaproteobacteria bacterium]|nr:hypothetical protein [Deltaproteobacteria bacterium]
MSVGIALIPGADRTQVEDAVERQVRAFLSPLTGGFDEAGWPLTRTVDAAGSRAWSRGSPAWPR